MKNITSLALAGALTTAVASGAVTDPVGYSTTTLPAGQATLVSLTLHESAVATSTVTGVTATTFTDTSQDFTALLSSGATYILEINDGAGAGTLQVISAWSGDTLTTPEDISSFVTAGVTKYTLRPAATVSSIFGPNNEAGLTSTPTGNPGTYDEVLVVNALGSFDSYFYYDDGSFTQWYDSGFATVQDNPLVYTDAIYVRRIAGSPIDLVVSGEVKLTPTSFVISGGNNFVGGVYPVGSTLSTSGLKDSVAADADGSPPFADQVLVQQPNGSYITYFYYNDGSFEQWYDLGFGDGTNVDISGGFVLQSDTVAPKAGAIAVPPYTL